MSLHLKAGPRRGLVKLRRLLDLKRTYPPAPFQKAVEEASITGFTIWPDWKNDSEKTLEAIFSSFHD